MRARGVFLFLLGLLVLVPVSYSQQASRSAAPLRSAPAMDATEKAEFFDEGERLFVEGQKKELEGDINGACEIYLRVAGEYPKSVSAGSALFQCAFLRDQREHDVNGAVPLYRRVLREYDTARVSKKAQIRLSNLEPFEGEWAALYRQVQETLAEKEKLAIEEFEDRIFGLMEANPGYPGADQLLFFLARTSFKEKRYDRARKFFLQVIRSYPGTQSAAFAYKGLGDLEFLEGKYALSTTYYDAATAVAEQLGMPPPSPLQRRKAHLYVARYQVLLGVLSVMAICGMGLIYLAPARRPEFGSLVRSWGTSSLQLLPLFGILYGIAYYLVSDSDPSSALNIIGHEPLFVAMVYVLVCASLFVGMVVLLGAEHRPGGKAIFWTAFPLLLLGANFCLYYWLDLTMYLEYSLLGMKPNG